MSITSAWRHRNRSKPGEVPHVDTGELRRSIGCDTPRPLTRRIGSGIGSATRVGYGAMLEYGTARMAARPWLRPAIWALRDTIKAIISTPMR